MATKTQIKKAMTKAGIEGELRGAGEEWEVELADEETKDRFFAEMDVDCGGFRTGYGAYVLRPNYKSPGDYNDPSTAWHR